MTGQVTGLRMPTKERGTTNCTFTNDFRAQNLAKSVENLKVPECVASWGLYATCCSVYLYLVCIVISLCLLHRCGKFIAAAYEKYLVRRVSVLVIIHRWVWKNERLSREVRHFVCISELLQQALMLNSRLYISTKPYNSNEPVTHVTQIIPVH